MRDPIIHSHITEMRARETGNVRCVECDFQWWVEDWPATAIIARMRLHRILEHSDEAALIAHGVRG